MGWRFRRSVKIAPGVRLNIGKRSIGASVGPRGAKVSANTRGEVRRTMGLPGTGLSYTEQSKLRSDSHDLMEVPLEELEPHELEYVRGRHFRKLVGWSSVLVIVVLIFAGAPTAAGYLIFPAIGLTIAAPWIARRLL